MNSMNGLSTFAATHALSTIISSLAAGWLLALLKQHLRGGNVDNTEMVVGIVMLLIGLAGLIDLW